MTFWAYWSGKLEEPTYKYQDFQSLSFLSLYLTACFWVYILLEFTVVKVPFYCDMIIHDYIIHDYTIHSLQQSQNISSLLCVNIIFKPEVS